MMSYELERAFGRVLGLDYSQVNPGALTNGETNGTLGWPVMQPLSGVCGPAGGACIPNPTVLRYDDIAALNRIYPITAANLASFPGKQLTAANTVSIQGTISLPHRPRHAGRERGRPPARRERQSALPVHGHASSPAPTSTASTATPSPAGPTPTATCSPGGARTMPPCRATST